MEVKDLMIGDWVHLLNGKVKEPVKVTVVGHATQDRKDIGTTVCIDGSVEFPTMLFGQSRVEPIPLTPEILEKNGFKYMTGLWYIRTKEKRPIQIVFKETNVITLSINCTPVPINLKYVHQLQHALRLCGIEKEIIL